MDGVTRIIESIKVDGQPVIRLCSAHLEVDVSPKTGGRIIGLRHLASGHEFLWKNSRLPLEPKSPGSEYDPNFYGGIDELLPNDIPEMIDGVSYPDHGELWTTQFDWRIDGETLVLEEIFPLCGLSYQRRIALHAAKSSIDIHYRITNESDREKHFLWKLHAALAISEGDHIDCPARQAQVVMPQYSRFSTLEPFSWPAIEGQEVNVVPPKGNTVDFFYLFDLKAGQVAWKRPSQNLKFEYTFDTSVFPFVWLFASYGGFEDHYTLILEPCTTMPISVDDAICKGRCSRLAPGETLETKVSIYAGPDG